MMSKADFLRIQNLVLEYPVRNIYLIRKHLIRQFGMSVDFG